MPTRSKFTAKNREIIVEAIRRGHSIRSAAAVARLTHTTVNRWLEEGLAAGEGTAKHNFALDVAEAEALAAGEMIEIVRRDATVEKNAKTALEWLKRRQRADWGDEPKATPAAPVAIELTFGDVAPMRVPNLVPNSLPDTAS